ncbi:hypothetical protein EAPG_02408 [Escherichia albertii B156]|nr:hypothetical protein EAPG_02408 [Escherichia albertii B156]
MRLAYHLWQFIKLTDSCQTDKAFAPYPT